MKIGIFGGSFNPLHNKHTDIAKYLIDANYVDKVIFVPTGTKYKYKNNLLSDEHRYNMVKLITDKNPDFLVSDFEQQEKTIYTCETLAHFQNLYPQDDIYFICGTDNLSYIDTWKNAEYILDNFHILVIKRDTDELAPILKKLYKYQHHIIVTDVPAMELSSTAIRESLKNMKNYLDKDVYEYILKNNLYE